LANGLCSFIEPESLNLTSQPISRILRRLLVMSDLIAPQLVIAFAFTYRSALRTLSDRNSSTQEQYPESEIRTLPNSLVGTAKLSYFNGMKPQDVIDRLKSLEPALRASGVGALYLFGSHARDEAGSESDVDVFVDPQSDESFGFLEFMKAYTTIVDAVGPNVEVGYSTREGLSRHIRDRVEREAMRIF